MLLIMLQESGTHPVPSKLDIPQETIGRIQWDYINLGTWAVYNAMVQFAFLVLILKNANGSTEHYIPVISYVVCHVVGVQILSDQ